MKLTLLGHSTVVKWLFRRHDHGVGQEIQCAGKIHEVIHPDLSHTENGGYFTDGILQPGTEWAKHIGAHTTYPIHDEVLSHKGRNLYDNVYKKLQVPGYQRLAHGVTVEA